jgi:hypothetical protein
MRGATRPISQLVPIRCLTLLLLLPLLAPEGARAWQAYLGGSFAEDRGTLVAFAPRRDVIVAGETEVSGDCARLTVARFARRGDRVWETRFARDCFRPGQLFVDDAGDVIVQGTEQQDESSTEDGVILKLHGDDGVVLWAYTLDLPSNESRGGITIEAVEESGSVVAVLKVVASSSTGDPALTYFRVVVDGDTGAERSRTQIAPPDPSPSPLRFVGPGVLRKERPDGSVVWERTIAGFDLPVTFVRALQIDRMGNVYLAGAAGGDPTSFDRDFTVVKLDGRDGRELWRHTLGEGPSARHGEARAMVLDRRGNVFATGAVASPTADSGRSVPRFAVVRIQSGRGQLRWLTYLAGEAGVGYAIALDRRGDVAVVGAGYPAGYDGSVFTAARLSGSTGRGMGAPRFWDPPE